MRRRHIKIDGRTYHVLETETPAIARTANRHANARFMEHLDIAKTYWLVTRGPEPRRAWVNRYADGSHSSAQAL